MALSKEEMEKIRNNAKSKVEEKESKKEVKENSNQELEDLKKRVAQLQKDKDKLKSDNNNLKHELASKSNGDSMLDQKKALDAMVMGNDGKEFVKKYSVPFDNNKNWDFVIRMHAPSVFEEGMIEDEFFDMTNGNGYHYSDEYIITFKAIAYLRVVGDEVPDELLDPQKLTRNDILIQIFTDFAGFLDTFRKNQKY